MQTDGIITGKLHQMKPDTSSGQMLCENSLKRGRRNRMILQNKILVTGAHQGIGRATAIALGTAGAKVVFSGRHDQEGEETARLIRKTGAECLFVHSDVTR